MKWPEISCYFLFYSQFEFICYEQKKDLINIESSSAGFFLNATKMCTNLNENRNSI